MDRKTVIIISSVFLLLLIALLFYAVFLKGEWPTGVGHEISLKEEDGYGDIKKEKDSVTNVEEKILTIIKPTREGFLETPYVKLETVKGKKFCDDGVYKEQGYQSFLKATFSDGREKILEETLMNEDLSDCYYSERLELVGLSPDSKYVIFQKGSHIVLRYYMLNIETGEYVSGFEDIYLVQDFKWSYDYQNFAIATLQSGYGGDGETAVYLGDESELKEVWRYEPGEKLSPYVDIEVSFVQDNGIKVKISREEMFFIEIEE